MSTLTKFITIVAVVLVLSFGAYLFDRKYTLSFNNWSPTVSIKHDVPVRSIYAIALELQSTIGRCEYDMNKDVRAGHTTPDCVKFSNAARRLRVEFVKHLNKHGESDIQKIFEQELTPMQLNMLNGIAARASDTDARIKLRD